MAPIHILIVPRKHISSIAALEDGEENLVGKMIKVAKEIAEKKGIAERGYKLQFNVGKEGGQLVYHLHLHLIGGKQLGEF